MKIAVLSGKGGTGKTFVSVNLAVVAGESTYIDCDVEEPNGHLFLRPTITEESQVMVKIPTVHKESCIGCKTCVQFCAFHALAFVKKKPLLFPEVCHSCGGCAELCPQQAITEVDKSIGSVQVGYGERHGVGFLGGQMTVGEVSAVPIIKKLLDYPVETPYTIIDCPPGSGCMVMESIQQADYCILVAEPTVFGAHNLEMVYDLVRLFHKPVGVVLNKCTDDPNPSAGFCAQQENLPILAKLPFQRDLAQENAKGEIVTLTHPDLAEQFAQILTTIEGEVAG